MLYDKNGLCAHSLMLCPKCLPSSAKHAVLPTGLSLCDQIAIAALAIYCAKGDDSKLRVMIAGDRRDAQLIAKRMRERDAIASAAAAVEFTGIHELPRLEGVHA